MGETQDAAAVLAVRYLQRPTGKQRLLAKLVSENPDQKLHSSDNGFQALCEHITRVACVQAAGGVARACERVHFKPLIMPHTKVELGHCGYLNSCRRKNTCPYLHYVVDDTPPLTPFHWTCSSLSPYPMHSQRAIEAPLQVPMQQLDRYGLGAWVRHGTEQARGWRPLPGQWINCDLHTFDLSALGHFDVVLADPPWDIHMSLPYGTLSDDDMRALNVPALQTEGLLFLWVTGRSMELGHELLHQWGYTRIDELIWIKTNQTERLVRTGRTGHWLNHSKEHCLVGIKRAKARHPPDAWGPGQISELPPWLHSGLGTDIVVAHVRDTSRKPDELYAMIEKLCPGGRKIELFGRRHNVRPGWLTLGNQLKSTYVVEPALRAACASEPSA